jgi:hypothetical protein
MLLQGCQYDKILLPMSKKRKTRAQKIITQLRKELERQRKQQLSGSQITQKNQKKSIQTKITYSLTPKTQASTKIKYSENKQSQSLPVSFDPALIKSDLLKTLYLSIFFFGLIGFTYWYLELGGEKIILRFFHL